MNAKEKDLGIIIEKLRKENRELRQKSVQYITKNVETMPADYEELKRENKRQRDRIAKLAMIVEHGNISTLDSLIEDYTNFSRDKLKKIAVETCCTNFSAVEVKKVLSLVEYLNYVGGELYGLVSIYEQGRFLGNPKYQLCGMKLVELQNLVNQKNLLSNIDPLKLDIVSQHIKTFIETIKSCFKEGDDVE